MQGETIKIKGAEVEGFTVELLSENKGATFRINFTDGVYKRTRVFTDYAEASALFDSYLQGN